MQATTTLQGEATGLSLSPTVLHDTEPGPAAPGYRIVRNGGIADAESAHGCIMACGFKFPTPLGIYA